MSKRRVAVTGLGLITPVGNTVASSWESILAGQSGAGPVTQFDVSDFNTQFAACVKDFDPATWMSPKDARKMDPFMQYGVAAGVQAMEDSGLEVTEENAWRIGVAIGSGIGGLPGIENAHNGYLKGGPRKISPFFVPANIINLVSGHISMKYGLHGPTYSIVTACSSGVHNIGDAARMIAYGDVDYMLAGGTEMATCPLGLGGFGAARALSTRNDSPEAASRPWDVDRDGFVLGDGAGVMMLEAYDLAVERGANIYAELVGFGMTSDAHHITAPMEDGEGARRCMMFAMQDAGLNPEDIAYVNAHGTSTPAGDKAETIAIRRAFESHAEKLAVSSTKSMIGHTLGAAGGIEAIFTVLALRDQVAPPTINLDNQDPECDLDYVPHTTREMKIEAALSNSFGFGGTNGTVIFKRV